MNKRIELCQSEIENLIEKYYKDVFNIDVCFRFFYVFYERRGPKHLIYDYIYHKWNHEREIVSDWRAVPCIIDKNVYNNMLLKGINKNIFLKGVVKTRHLKSIIDEEISQFATRISRNVLNDIMESLGYGRAYFKFYLDNLKSTEIKYKVRTSKTKKDEPKIKKKVKK